jgi:hypothetical protein
LTVRKSLHQYLAWYAPIVAIFIFANIYSLQPFTYDNHKLLLYVYLFTYIFASYGAFWLIRRRWQLIAPAILVAFLISASGTLAVAREFQRLDLFASHDDIALADWVKDSTRAADVFMTTDLPNHPVATLGGRTIVAGYRGWLYNYNLPYQPRIAAIQATLLGNFDPTNPYDAKYLAVSNFESQDWAVDQQAIATKYVRVYSNPSWTVYRLPTN